MKQAYDQVGLIVAAAGNSTRYGRSNKLFENLAGKPLFLHSMQRFWQVIRPSNTVIVAQQADIDQIQQILDRTVTPPHPVILEGGATRAESVLRGLRALSADLPLVAVQDAARPLTSLELLLACINSAQQFGSGIAARRLTDTIKLTDADGNVQQTLDRSLLWAAETPQVLQTQRLRVAYEEALANAAIGLTDDASALEAAGQNIRLVESREPNPKVTFAHDLSLAQMWLQLLKSPL